MTFGEFVRDIRTHREFTQKALAEQIGISPQYLNDIELDRRAAPSDKAIDQFATVLNTSSDLLFILAGRIPPDIRKSPHLGQAFKLVRAWEAQS